MSQIAKQRSTERRPDVRVQRTQKALQEALIRLLKEVEYSEITVSSLAREAGVNRKTFYLHYSSVDDVLAQILLKRVVDIGKEVGSQVVDYDADNRFREMTRAILEEMAQRSWLSSNVMQRMSMAQLLSMIQGPLTQMIVEMRVRKKLAPIENIEYCVACYLGAILSAFECWEMAGDKRPPIELVAYQVADCGLAGLNILI